MAIRYVVSSQRLHVWVRLSQICLWSLRSRKVEAGRMELPTWARRQLGSEVTVTHLSNITIGREYHSFAFYP